MNTVHFLHVLASIAQVYKNGLVTCAKVVELVQNRLIPFILNFWAKFDKKPSLFASFCKCWPMCLKSP